METSLIGKAVVFGSKECRFEPCVSNVTLTKNSINLIKLFVSNKKPVSRLYVNKKEMPLLLLLESLGIVNLSFKKLDNSSEVRLSCLSFKNIVIGGNIKLISCSSKKLYISVYSLRKLSKILNSTILILQTSSGVLHHSEAIKLGLSGKVLMMVSY